jgi:hypothetical protein
VTGGIAAEEIGEAVTGARSGQRRSWRHCGLGRPVVHLRLALLLAAAVIAAHLPGPASAQQRRPGITVPAVVHVKFTAPTALPIQVAPMEAVPHGCFIRLRGLPVTAALSDGHTVAPGAWAVPISALADLKVLVPAGARARSDIVIALLSPEGSVLAEAKATLVAASASLPATGVPPDRKEAALQAPGPPPPEVQPRAPKLEKPPLSAEAHERALRLVKKGNEQLAEGGVAQARLLYERAAEAGFAPGAMAMAATYDAVELERLGVRGLKPDHEAARRWYERARQLGAVEADERLRRLGAKR